MLGDGGRPALILKNAFEWLVHAGLARVGSFSWPFATFGEGESWGRAKARPYNYFLVGQNDLLPDEVDAHADL